jgi:kynurenine formamidase
MQSFIELSHPIVEGMKTFPGLPDPKSVFLVGQAGSPCRRFADAPELSQLPLDRFAELPFVHVAARAHFGRGIGPHAISLSRGRCSPAHTVLPGHGITIREHMTNLGALAAAGGRLHAAPIAWKGGTTFPVRAYVVRTSA